jgi:hypothetical protein
MSPHADSSVRRSAFRLSGSVTCAAVLLIAASTASAVDKQKTMVDLIDSSAAVFVGTAESVDIAAGNGKIPRTRVRIAVEKVLVGDPPEVVEFDLPEGLLGNGNFVFISETPKFVAGETYLLFYQAGSWPFSPVSNGRYFRKITVDGRSVFTTSDGLGITAVVEEGFVAGPILVTESSGQRALNSRSKLPMAEPTEAQGRLAQTCIDADSVLDRIRNTTTAAKPSTQPMQLAPTAFLSE